MTPFTNLLKGQMRKSTKPISWSDHLDKSVRTLTEHVCHAHSFLLQDPSKPCEVVTDASEYGVGAIFIKMENLNSVSILSSKKQTIFYYTYTKSWRHYLYGNCFVLTMEHKSLKYFCDQQDLIGPRHDGQNSFRTSIFLYDIVMDP